MDDGYRFKLSKPHDFGELERIAALLRIVFPRADQLTARYLRWQYAENPDGEAVGCNAFAGDSLVGHMAAVPMVGRLDGEVCSGLFMLNGAVDPAHRRRRLQSRISAMIFEESVRRGFAFCFGTGNRYSTVPLLTRFEMVRPLEARIGIGMPVRRAGGHPPSFERVWSQRALEWRLGNPERDYSVSAEGGSVTVEAETGTPGVAAILLHASNQWRVSSRNSALAALRVWIGLDPDIDWRRSAFIPVPRVLRPSPLNLVFRDLRGRGHVPDPGRVVFRAIDFDVY